MSDTEQILRILTEHLKGELKHYIVSDKNKSYNRIVIEYAHSSKSTD